MKKGGVHMKKLTFALVILLLLTGVSFAAGLGDSPRYNNAWPSAMNTLLSVAGIGNGTAVDLGAPVSNFGCTVTWSGTNPTNTTVALYGAQDGVNFQNISSNQTITQSGTYFGVTATPGIRWILGNFSAKTGGDTTTKVSMTCTAGGN